MIWAVVECLQHLGHVGLRQYAYIGRQGLEQFDRAIMRPTRSSRAIPRLPLQRTKRPGP